MTASSASPAAVSTGYYGNLDARQQAVLAELKKMLLEKHGIRQEAAQIDERFIQKDFADAELRYDLELLRFLRARRFDLHKTYQMYMAAIEWREKQAIDALYRSFDYEQSRAAFREHFPSYLHKCDRTGSPVHIHELSKIDLTGLFRSVTQDQAIQHLFLLSESNIRRRFPGCTIYLRETMPSDPKIVDTVTAIFDLKNVSLLGFWKVKDLLYRLIQISDNYYPETANKLFVINSPTGFAKIWTYVKGWLDARTASRVFILGSDYQTTLFQHIDESQLPQHLGGTCECAEHSGRCRDGDIGPWNSA